jgi:diacylglycerol O-acyltransferase
MRHMNNMDAAFLYFETPTMHMHVVGVLVLDGSDVPGGFGLADVRAALEQRIHLIAPLRRRMVAPIAGVGHPVWVEDPGFVLTDHVLPAPLEAPVTWRAMERFVGDVAGRPLDRHRPLWEMWVVEGLDDGTVALVTKLHHSIMDGGASADLMASLFDLAPDVGEVTPEATPWRPDRVPSAVMLAARSTASFPRYLWDVPRTLAQTTWSLADTAGTWVRQRVAGTAAPPHRSSYELERGHHGAPVCQPHARRPRRGTRDSVGLRCHDQRRSAGRHSDLIARLPGRTRRRSDETTDRGGAGERPAGRGRWLQR